MKPFYFSAAFWLPAKKQPLCKGLRIDLIVFFTRTWGKIKEVIPFPSPPTGSIDTGSGSPNPSSVVLTRTIFI